jgi:cytochrome c oxidase accessory protein FixG
MLPTMTTSAKEPKSFRDHIATADQTGRRLWVYPQQPSGRLYRARTIVASILLTFFFVAPFLEVGGQPLILLDVIGRHFIFFGLVFTPHDLHMVVLAVLTAAVLVVLFTAVLGRLFCGWLCPQTVFLEMVFRRIEYWIDGTPNQQRKLREGPWTVAKVGKGIAKQSIFFALSFVIGNFALAYFIGMDELSRIIAEPLFANLPGLTAMLAFAFIIHFVFGWFREQACTIVCPYGRLQGVLLDSNSILVAYDYGRGEPRARLKRDDPRIGLGDCVECKACVRVCPTGIDIRNGTQLECVNCTACIDACNDTMRRVKFPEGLIRYTSEARIAGKRSSRFTGRVILYGVVAMLLSMVLTVLVVTRTDVETTLLRAPGTLYYEGDHGTIRNLYTVKFVNRTIKQMPLELRLTSPEGGTIAMVQGAIELAPDGMAEASFFVELPVAQVSGPATPISIEVASDGVVIEEIVTSFMGPGKGGSR